MWPRTWLTLTDGRRSGDRHGRQAASADRLRAGINGSGGGGHKSEIGKPVRRTADRTANVADNLGNWK